MYLHLGQHIVVPEATVIGVFDLDNTTGSHITREFLKEAEKAGKVKSVSDELPKSFVVCGEQHPGYAKRSMNIKRHADACNEFEIYLSQLSSMTLLKRSETVRFD